MRVYSEFNTSGWIGKLHEGIGRYLSIIGLSGSGSSKALRRVLANSGYVLSFK